MSTDTPAQQWRMVPVEPTDDMMRALVDPFIAINGGNRSAFIHAYAAMLAAAPQPAQSQDLRAAAQAVLDRWDSPRWQWTQQGPTADLMADLRGALGAQPAQEPVAWANAASLASASVSRSRGGPFDIHTWSEGKTNFHDAPLYAAPAQPAPAVAELVDALRGMLNIVHDSAGVYGYHLNGDGAEWDEFDEVNAARAALSRYQEAKP